MKSPVPTEHAEQAVVIAWWSMYAPLKGVDIIRELDTGNLYVLELNCSGATWHISSAFWAKFRKGPMSRENMIVQKRSARRSLLSSWTGISALSASC